MHERYAHVLAQRQFAQVWPMGPSASTSPRSIGLPRFTHGIWLMQVFWLERVYWSGCKYRYRFARTSLRLR